MEAYLDWQKKSGGIKLNDVIEDFKYVYKGQTIKAGDFVNYVNGVSGITNYGTSTDTQLDTVKYSAYNTISTVALDDNRVFIAHNDGNSQNGYLYGMVVTINGTTITAGTDTQLSTGSNSGYGISAVLLEDGNVFIAHSYSSTYLYGIVCTINGTVITKGTDTSISDISYTGYYHSIELLPNNKVFIAHSYNSNYHLYGVVVTINGTTITKGTVTQIVGSSQAGYAISTCLLPNGNIFIAHSYNTNYYLYGIVCTISGTSITKGSDTALNNSTTYTGNAISACLLPNGNVFIAHSYSNATRYLYGMIVTINDKIITKGVDNALVTDGSRGFVISTCLLSNGNVFIAYDDGQSRHLFGVVININGTTITTGTGIKLVNVIFAGSEQSTLLLNNGTIFIAHDYSDNHYLYAQIFGIDEANNIPTNNISITEYEQQVTSAIEPPFNAIALSSGVGGTDTEHNEQVKIARPNVEVI